MRNSVFARYDEFGLYYWKFQARLGSVQRYHNIRWFFYQIQIYLNSERTWILNTQNITQYRLVIVYLNRIPNNRNHGLDTAYRKLST